VKENAGQKDWERKKNGGNPQGMADPVDWVLMAGRIVRDPLLAGAFAQHYGDDTSAGNRWPRILADSPGAIALKPAWDPLIPS